MNARELEATQPKNEHRDGESRFLFWQPRPDLLVSKVYGHISTPIAAAIIAAADRAGPRFSHFINWWEVQSYDIASQRDLTLFTARHVRRFESVHLLTKSALVRVGVSAANVPLSGLIKLSSEPDTFYRQLDEALAGRAGR